MFLSRMAKTEFDLHADGKRPVEKEMKTEKRNRKEDQQ